MGSFVVMSMGVIVVMVVIAVLVVNMVVMMAMRVMIVAMRRMIVRGVIVPGVRMHSRLGRRPAGIGAAFGIERRLDLDEGTALRRGLELTLARGHEGRREFSDLAQHGCVMRGRRTVRLRQKYAVAKSGAVGQHRGEPIAQAGGIDDIAGLHRPFDAAGIGERAHRK